MSCFNLLFAGPLVHAWIAPRLFKCISPPWKRIWETCGIVVIHSGLYAFIHRCMHRICAFRGMHVPHHKFDAVTSSVANAVTVDEFIVAYIVPFIVGA